MGLSCIVSERDGDFSRKSQKIFPPRVFCAPAEGAWCQKQNDAANGPRKMFDNIFSRLDTMHERDG